MASGNEVAEAHPPAAAAAAATLPPIAAPEQQPPPPFAAPAVRSTPHLARLALLLIAALVSASWFVEPFAAAAADLRVPWPAVVATLVLVAALFCASVCLFGSFFLRLWPSAATAADAAATTAQTQRKGVGAVAAAVDVVVVGVSACLVAAGGSAYGYAPARR